MMRFLRRLKILYLLYNMCHKKALGGNVHLYKKYGIRKRYYSPISMQDFMPVTDTFEPSSPTFDHSLAKCLKQLNLDESSAESLRNWQENGYAIIRRLLSPTKVDAVNEEVDRLIRQKKVRWKYGNKIMFAIKRSELLRAIGQDEKVLQILSSLLGREAELFQSINFLTGSQQRSHSDAIHMTTFPEGNLIAIWIALEDIDRDCGPLHYYPGSHQLGYVYNGDYGNQGSTLLLGPKPYSSYEDKISELLTENPQYEKKIFTAKKGDALIWHANLLHGGEPIAKPGATRRSMVFHYFGKDVICFHEITQRPALKSTLLAS